MPTILASRYLILRTLGIGYSCKVKLSQHLTSGQFYAIKIFHK